MPQIEDSRSQGEKEQDKVLQQQICQTNCKSLISDPTESNKLFNMLNDDPDLLSYFNDHFPEIKNKYAVQKNIKAFFVIQSLNKMYHIENNTAGVNQPLQTNEFFSVFPSEAILRAIYSKLEEELNKGEQGDEAVNIEAVLQALDKVEALIEISDGAEELIVSPENLQLIQESGIPSNMDPNADISQILLDLDSVDVNNISQVDDILLNSQHGSPAGEAVIEPNLATATVYQTTDLVGMSDELLHESLVQLMQDYISANHDKNSDVINSIDQSMIDFDDEYGARIKVYLQSLSHDELILELNSAREDYDYFVKSFDHNNADDLTNLKLIELNIKCMNEVLDSYEKHPSKDQDLLHDEVPPYEEPTLDHRIINFSLANPDWSQEEIADMFEFLWEDDQEDPENDYDVDWEDSGENSIADFSISLIDSMLDLNVNNEEKSKLNDSVHRIEAIVATVDGLHLTPSQQAEFQHLAPLHKMSSVLQDDRLSDHQKEISIAILTDQIPKLIKDITSADEEAMFNNHPEGDATASLHYDPLEEEAQTNTLLVYIKPNTDDIVTPIGEFRLDGNILKYCKIGDKVFHKCLAENYNDLMILNINNKSMDTDEINWIASQPLRISEFKK